MTGKRYYLATLAAWQRHAARSTETHFIVLDSAAASFTERPVAQASVCAHLTSSNFQPPKSNTGNVGASFSSAQRGPEDSAQILVLVTADEAAHIALENDAEVEALPHPLARTPISERAAAALAPLGVNAGDDTFTVAEKLARVSPLLRHRVF